MRVYQRLDWTITNTVVWICLRSPVEMDQIDDIVENTMDVAENKLGVISIVPAILERREFPYRRIPRNERELVVSIGEADRQLKELLSQGALRCSGVCVKRESLPAEAWSVRNLRLASNTVIDTTDGRVWTDVLFRRTDILKFWPSPSGIQGEESQDSDGPGSAMTEIGQITERQALEDWYKSRVEQWTGRQPTAEEDKAAAREYTGRNISRKRIAELREKFAPQWTKRGRPRKM